MIDYYETKSQPITRVMVWQAYRKVRANKGSAGIDEMSWADLDKDLNRQLYKLWNRLTSGSYFPMPVREVEISKGLGGGVRKLGIPKLLSYYLFLQFVLGMFSVSKYQQNIRQSVLIKTLV